MDIMRTIFLTQKKKIKYISTEINQSLKKGYYKKGDIQDYYECYVKNYKQGKFRGVEVDPAICYHLRLNMLEIFIKRARKDNVYQICKRGEQFDCEKISIIEETEGYWNAEKRYIDILIKELQNVQLSKNDKNKE